MGYHFIIERDGLLELVLDLEEDGYHAGYTVEAHDNLDKFPGRDKQYYNKYYWSCCIVGNDPTDAQLETMILLGIAVKRAEPKASFWGHRELAGKEGTTECPGFAFNMDYVRREIDTRTKRAAGDTGPTQGDDAFFRQYKTWREAAINAKGIADDFGNKVVDSLRDEREARLALQRAMEVLNGRIEINERLTGK